MISIIVFCLLMTVYGLSVLANVSYIGKERKPLTPQDVCWHLIIIGLMVWGIAANWNWS